MLRSALPYIFASACIFFGCDTKTPEPEEKPEISAEKIARQEYKNQNANFFPRSTWAFKTELTNHYLGCGRSQIFGEKCIPKAALLLDYPTNAQFTMPDVYFVADLGGAFEDKLPAAIRDELARYDLIGKKAVDIFWVAQGNTTLGEDIDHNGVPTTTRIAPHGWTDPDAPAEYSGHRVNRDFLLGIFETENDIATEKLKPNLMVPARIEVHDKLFSPRNPERMVKIGALDPSQSFWSLVIDNNNPEHKVRALATLHWVISSDLINTIKKIEEGDKSELRPGNNRKTIRFDTFEDVLSKLNKVPALKGTEMLRRLNYLFE